ncbi:MAG: tyrosine-type recombinase/integrase [Ilumatobacteraceae bacterium]|nr:tyrosine-type recombinase/integrase [Ilumatobacteraceae bacterium]
MATIGEKRPGVWEVRVFAGADAHGRPPQMSRTVHGCRRDAQRLAAQLEASGGKAKPAGRSVGDVLVEGVKQNLDTWAQSSARDQQSRVRSIKKDQIARLPLARLTVADVERWHTRLRSTKVQQRSVMSVDEVRAVMSTAASIDAAAELALRLAAVAGARRAELASLRWTEEHHGHPTKTANVRTVTLVADTVELIANLRQAREPYGPWMFALGPEVVSPDRISWWWRRARQMSGIDLKWRLHDLRHWSATVAIGQGHDVRTVAARLGHANPAMTLRVYAHAFAAADQDLAAGLGEILKG